MAFFSKTGLFGQSDSGQFSRQKEQKKKKNKKKAFLFIKKKISTFLSFSRSRRISRSLVKVSFYGEAKKTEDTCRSSARARVFCALLSQRSFTAADEAEDYFYSGDFCV